MDSDTEVIESENEGVENEVLHPERKRYFLRNLPSVNCSDKLSTWHYMGSKNLIDGFNKLHNDEKSYINVVNAITSSVKPTPPTNIVTNETILTQYIIK